jgi:hypothetical protein
MRSLIFTIMTIAIAAMFAAAPIVNACEGNEVLFQDYFRSPREWPTPPDGFHAVRDGKLLIAPALNLAYLTSVHPNGRSLVDMDACVDVALVRGGTQMVHTYGGLAFWIRSRNDYYLIVIGPSGTFAVERWFSNRYLTIVPFTTSTAVKSGPNQVNRLRVTTRGNAAVLYINGIQVANMTGQPPPGGGDVGFVAESGSKTRDIYAFMNFKVTN